MRRIRQTNFFKSILYKKKSAKINELFQLLMNTTENIIKICKFNSFVPSYT